MRVAFQKSCSCSDILATYPTPSISTRAPKPLDPLVYVEIAFACPICGVAWRGMLADNFGELDGSALVIVDSRDLRAHV
jgi:hypothetical protein